jgi:hypothetical protein
MWIGPGLAIVASPFRAAVHSGGVSVQWLDAFEFGLHGGVGVPQVVVLLHSKPDLRAVAEQPAETERWERAAARAAEASKRVEAERKAIADA